MNWQERQASARSAILTVRQRTKAWGETPPDDPLLPPAVGDPPLVCPKCGGERQTDRLLFCFACCVSFDDDSLTYFTQTRDKIADWLIAAEPVLVALYEQDDERYPKAKAMWDMRLKNYQALCFLVPEVA